jgi:hypothetical protein
MADRRPGERSTMSRAWYLLLLLPFIGLLWPPFYAKDAPRLGASRSSTGTSSSGCCWARG